MSERLAVYRRATDYIAAAMIYLQGNHLLEEPLRPEHIKHRLLGHWGTVPGLNLMYAGLNRLILDTQASMLLVTGPGHGAPANLANLWIDGCLQDIRPDMGRSGEGLGTLVREFSWPGGFPSHIGPMVPGTIHEGGELGYALATAFGAALDNPELIVACIIGDGEAETGPTAGAWHCNKFLDPVGSGAVLPMLHVNGYKIANPTIYGTMNDSELTKLFEGFGWHPMIVDGEDLDGSLASALDIAYAEIREIQDSSRAGNRPERPCWPMLVVRSPKGMGGIRELDGIQIEGTSKAHQVPAMRAKSDAEHLAALEGWLRSYRPEELFDANGGPAEAVAAMCPTGDLRMGANPHVNGGKMRVPLKLPAVEDHALDVPHPGAVSDSSVGQLGKYLGDVFRLNAQERNFRIVCPDEVASNRLGAVFEVEDHAYEWPVDSNVSPDYKPGGRIMEVLSEHNCQGWMQGYVLTGRHCIFPCYEAFIPIVDGMVNQYGKFLKMSVEEAPWREPVASLNYLLTSEGWRQDHNGYSHQMPGFINSMLNRREETARVYLPPDANTLLATMELCLEAERCINLIIASKLPMAQWLSAEAAREHVRAGASAWDWAGSEVEGESPDLILCACGTVPTIELLAAADILRREVPSLKIRFVNVTNLFTLSTPDNHPDGMSAGDFRELFTDARPVIFNFHGYPSAVHQLIHRRPRQERFHVRGYAEEGTTTTPFELLAMNGVDRYQLAIEALSRVDAGVSEQVRGMSGGFAVRNFVDAQTTIDKLRGELAEHRRYVRDVGNDPPEISNWSWPARPAV
ncbi:MAG TPA: phosphoketolase family protein [Solirubrobacteraceae bacterium]|nr:phosphoketolase family protein [Solirubrobacteraceae bacterium]